MKKKIFLFAGIIAAFFLTACSQLEGGSIDGGYNADYCKINISAYSEDHHAIKQGMNGARTILPVAFTGDGLTFKISGVSHRGEVLNESDQVLSWTAGKAEITLSFARWTLTLKAYDADGDLVLSDTTFVDLTRGASEIKFIMLPDASTGTKGNVSITGTYINYQNTQVVPAVNNVKTIKAGLYRKDDVLYNDPVYEFTDVTGAAVDGTINYVTAAKSIDAGNYNFIMSFLDENDDEIGFYSELVIVDPGNTSIKVFSDLNVINQTPEPPEELKAWYVEGSAGNGFYNVKLTWKDKSSNEKFFNLIVTEYTDNTTVAGQYADVNANIVSNDSLYVSGSLASSSEECVIRLPLGRMFDVKLCAVGVGSSIFCEREAAASETGFTGYEAADERITLTQVIHDLAGGSLSLSGTPFTGASYTTYQIYKTTSPVTLLDIDGTTNVLVKVDGTVHHPFVEWQMYDESTRKWVTAAVNTFKNISVKAFYNLNYVISYVIPGYTDLDPSWVTCTYGTGNTNCLNGVVDARGTAKTITVSVNNDASHDVVFDEFEYRLNNQTLFRGDYTAYTNPNTYSFDTTDLDSKLYVVEVMARQKDTENWFSFSFGITISR